MFSNFGRLRAFSFGYSFFTVKLSSSFHLFVAAHQFNLCAFDFWTNVTPQRNWQVVFLSESFDFRSKWAILFSCHHKNLHKYRHFNKNVQAKHEKWFVKFWMGNWKHGFGWMKYSLRSKLLLTFWWHILSLEIFHFALLFVHFCNCSLVLYQTFLTELI